MARHVSDAHAGSSHAGTRQSFPVMVRADVEHVFSSCTLTAPFIPAGWQLNHLQYDVHQGRTLCSLLSLQLNISAVRLRSAGQLSSRVGTPRCTLYLSSTWVQRAAARNSCCEYVFNRSASDLCVATHGTGKHATFLTPPLSVLKSLIAVC